jgi:ATP-dependent RNA helicase SUPV3L1/SUV3
MSSTIEMANYSKKYDVAVIDEVQMIADQKRGHSWT